jgi:glycosyltransferase involved in cell wall biosynthesis
LTGEIQDSAVDDNSRTSYELRVIAYPYSGIAYNNSFYKALAKRIEHVIEGEWAGEWIKENLKKGDVVHIHWPSFLYASRGSYPYLIVTFVRFAMLLMLIRSKRAKIVWTTHNVLPHERARIPILDVIGRHLVIAVSSRVYVHSEEAGLSLAQRFPRVRRKCWLIPHGNWIGQYGPKPQRSEARARLGVPDDAYMYLMFGQLKPYKNIVGLVKTFRRMASSNDFLIIAGRFSDSAYLRDVAAAKSGDERVIIHAEFIPDSEVAVYLSASDIMCIPYQEILTSGTAMLSLSYGRPVLSIDRGFLRDTITRDVGILVPPQDDLELEKAMRVARVSDWDESAIIEYARKYNFDDAAEKFVNGLNQIRSHRV